MSFRDFAAEFDRKRDAAMVSNILRYAKQFDGKRLVVLCGYEHRHVLRQALLERSPEDGFVLREFRAVQP